MTPAGFDSRWVGGTLLAAAALCVGAAMATVSITRPLAQLQQAADDAALAGVDALAASIGQPGEARIKSSVAASQKALAGRTETLRSLSGSAEALTLTVELEGPRGDRAASQARYQAPSDGFAARDSAALPTSPLAPGDQARM